MGVLRALLALTVVLSHAGLETFVGSRNAVQLFYIVSGFLITYVLNNKEAYSSLLSFYASRALRIYPIYFFVAGVALFFPFYGDYVRHLYRAIPSGVEAILILSNIFVFGQDLVMFLGVRDGSVKFTAMGPSDYILFRGLLVPQAWSLGIELCFYLIAPFIVRDKVKVIFALFFSCLLRLAFYLSGYGSTDPWTYRFFPFELALFMLGSISCHSLLPFWSRVEKRSSGFALGSVVGLICIFLLFRRIEISEPYKSITLFVVFSAFLPLAFIFQGRSRIDQFFGELSYPIYIGHLLVFSMIASNGYLFGSMSPDQKLSLNVAMTLVFAMFLKWALADRIEVVRSRFTGRK
jgi:peptidoglycan/LPS O-acetylase OafA/YrhL